MLRWYIKNIGTYLCPSDAETRGLYAGKTSLAQLENSGGNRGGLNGNNSSQFSYGMTDQTTKSSVLRQSTPIKLAQNVRSKGIVADAEPYPPAKAYVYRLRLLPTSGSSGQWDSALSVFHSAGSNFARTDGSVGFGNKTYLRLLLFSVNQCCDATLKVTRLLIIITSTCFKLMRQ